MTERKATMTVIRGEGECMAIVNGVVQKELQRLQEEAHREMELERLRTRRELAVARAESMVVRERRNRMLLERLERVTENYRPKRGPVEWISTGWGVMWGTIFAILGKD